MIFRRCFLMKKRSIAVLLITLAAALLGVAAWCLNADYVFMGHSHWLPALSCITSVVFIAACYAICFVNRRKTVSYVLALYTGLVAVIWIVGLIVGCFSISVDVLLPFILVLLPPYGGIAALIGDLAGGILSLASVVVLFCINLYWYKKKCT